MIGDQVLADAWPDRVQARSKHGYFDGVWEETQLATSRHVHRLICLLTFVYWRKLSGYLQESVYAELENILRKILAAHDRSIAGIAVWDLSSTPQVPCTNVQGQLAAYWYLCVIRGQFGMTVSFRNGSVTGKYVEWFT